LIADERVSRRERSGGYAGIRSACPALVVQGTADPFVFEPLDTAFTSKLIATGSAVAYKTYPGTDYGSIITAADSRRAHVLGEPPSLIVKRVRCLAALAVAALCATVTRTHSPRRPSSASGKRATCR